jgi:hypothetical protein
MKRILLTVIFFLVFVPLFAQTADIGWSRVPVDLQDGLEIRTKIYIKAHPDGEPIYKGFSYDLERNIETNPYTVSLPNDTERWLIGLKPEIVVSSETWMEDGVEVGYTAEYEGVTYHPRQALPIDVLPNSASNTIWVYYDDMKPDEPRGLRRLAFWRW